jgi:DNA-3-methyladenine glycosylase II
MALGLRKRPDAKALSKLAEAWRPWRGVAAHLLWAYYRVLKNRDVTPLQANGRSKKAGKQSTRRKNNG